VEFDVVLCILCDAADRIDHYGRLFKNADTFRDWKQRSTVFEEVAAFAVARMSASVDSITRLGTRVIVVAGDSLFWVFRGRFSSILHCLVGTMRSIPAYGHARLAGSGTWLPHTWRLLHPFIQVASPAMSEKSPSTVFNEGFVRRVAHTDNAPGEVRTQDGCT
jgi:hypothetical protein